MNPERILDLSSKYALTCYGFPVLAIVRDDARRMTAVTTDAGTFDVSDAALEVMSRAELMHLFVPDKTSEHKKPFRRAIAFEAIG